MIERQFPRQLTIGSVVDSADSIQTRHFQYQEETEKHRLRDELRRQYLPGLNTYDRREDILKKYSADKSEEQVREKLKSVLDRESALSYYHPQSGTLSSEHELLSQVAFDLSSEAQDSTPLPSGNWYIASSGKWVWTTPLEQHAKILEDYTKATGEVADDYWKQQEALGWKRLDNDKDSVFSMTATFQVANVSDNLGLKTRLNLPTPQDNAN